eukprot:TRINITY_DN495_c0_g1_i2.p1 TRINITY_DN495_c0_g1~~TRINITY_DN495_c0_g1_i2.p1  ORF type:complete len:756 (+),score=40.76 TRINITY_DN495_c0_g1_i2:2154-4421(+)
MIQILIIIQLCQNSNMDSRSNPSNSSSALDSFGSSLAPGSILGAVADRTHTPQLPITTSFPPQKDFHEILDEDDTLPLVQRLLRKRCGLKQPCVLSQGSTAQRIVQESLASKYMTKLEAYNAKVINDIIYNENTHIVSVFKDYLIYDDISEFLKRYYAGFESDQRLPKIYHFYDKYSKVFPNYIALPENKLMFKNIERKQRVIDEQQKNEEKKDRLQEETSDNKVLDTNFINELQEKSSSKAKMGDSSESQQHSTLMKSYMKSISKNSPKKDKPKKKLEDMELQELVDKFISKESISIVNMTGKTLDFEYSVLSNRSKAKPAAPKALPNPVPLINTRLVHIRSSSEVAIAPVQVQKTHPKLPLKDLPAGQPDGSPLTVPAAKSGVMNPPSRNSGANTVKSRGTVQQKGLSRAQSDVYLRSISTGTFAKQSQYETRPSTKKIPLRSQSIGKRTVPEIIRGKAIAQDKMLPALDNSPIMKKEAIAQKYNAVGRRKKSSQHTEGTKATSKDEPGSKGDFCYYVNALKDPWVRQSCTSRKNSGTRGDSSPTQRPFHKKTMSADMKIVGPQLTIRVEGRNQKPLGVEIATAKTVVGRQKTVSEVTKTAKHVEQVYFKKPQAFKSEYLNSLSKKRQQTTQKAQFQSAQKAFNQVNKTESTKKPGRSESQKGLSGVRSASTLPLPLGKPVKIVISGYGAYGRFSGVGKRQEGLQQQGQDYNTITIIIQSTTTCLYVCGCIASALNTWAMLEQQNKQQESNTS